jgi:hypothetical protein
MGNCKRKDYFENRRACLGFFNQCIALDGNRNLEPGKPGDRWCDSWLFADDH